MLTVSTSPVVDGDVSVPEIFQVEVHFGTMHAEIVDALVTINGDWVAMHGVRHSLLDR